MPNDAAQVAVNTREIQNLKEAIVNLTQQLADHRDEDKRSFSSQEKLVTELRLANSKWLGVMAAIVGILSLIGTVASVIAAMK